MEHYQSVCDWKCKLSNLLKDFTSCVIFLFVCKSKVANILTSKLINKYHHASWIKRHAPSLVTVVPLAYKYKL